MICCFSKFGGCLYLFLSSRTALLTKAWQAPITWGQAKQQSFDALKVVLTSAPVLARLAQTRRGRLASSTMPRSWQCRPSRSCLIRCWRVPHRRLQVEQADPGVMCLPEPPTGAAGGPGSALFKTLPVELHNVIARLQSLLLLLLDVSHYYQAH